LGRNVLSDFESGRIVGLREAGWSNRRIGRHLGWSDMVVAQCWQQWITEGTVYRRRGSGCPRNTTDIDSTPLTTFQASGGIKGNHSETTGRRWYKEPMSSKTSTTDPTSLAQCFQGYDVLPWPARTPDLLPIEHVWDVLGR
uniref:Tc3 transposase DNA binding domain-containing protein n=1 Tax=Astyanax mexicanus TaxID=7994 RepID=A0A8B9JSY9_ASTMX